MSHASSIHEISTGDFSVRSILIQGRRFCLVWDTLTHPRDMAQFAEVAASQQCFVVYSHGDWDHIQGTAALHNPLVIGHRECLMRFQGEALTDDGFKELADQMRTLRSAATAGHPPAGPAPRAHE